MPAHADGAGRVAADRHARPFQEIHTFAKRRLHPIRAERAFLSRRGRPVLPDLISATLSYSDTRERRPEDSIHSMLNVPDGASTSVCDEGISGGVMEIRAGAKLQGPAQIEP